MNLALLLACILCASLMGFAIQRGATCTVAAVEEILEKGRCHRLVSMIEASAWVLGGLLIWKSVHGLTMAPAGYALTRATVVGGALLGFGAFVNRACVFGAIARFGSGEWAYIFTPVGFYIGCVLAVKAGWTPTQRLLAEGNSVVLGASPWWILLFVVFASCRMLTPWLGRTTHAQELVREIGNRVWSPHAATAVIGINFLVLLLAAGAWTYTDLLADLAHGMAKMLVSRGVLLLALLAGAAFGGWTAGRWRHTAIRWPLVLRCTCGGALMAFGSLLIPGGNDGLILLGMPLLWPFAWVAFGSMSASIAASMLIRRRMAKLVLTR